MTNLTYQDFTPDRAQEFFDAAFEVIIAQGPSKYDGQCVYRSPEGHKCAFGLFIPNSEYRGEFEGTDVMSLDAKFNLGMDRESIRFFRLLQSSHDGAGMGLDFKKSYIEKMRSMAEHLNLNTDAIDRWEAEHATS